MAIPGNLSKITGSWTGVNRLWLMPEDPVQESEAHAVVGLAAQGKFLNIQYTWEVEGQLQEGLMVIGSRKGQDGTSVYWIDSWHMDDAHMILNGTTTEDGGISVLGSYSFEGGPDWGWRIVIVPQENGKFLLQMYNITPEGQEARAVEVHYSRNV